MSEKTRLQAKKAEAAKRTAPVQRAGNSSVSRSLAGEAATAQRIIDNRAVQKFYESGRMQAKLAVGPAGDKYEKEADATADRVMSMPGPAVCRETDDEEMVNAKPLSAGITPLVMRTEAEDEPVQGKLLQKQEKKEDEPVKDKLLQRQEEKKEEDKVVQNKPDEEDYGKTVRAKGNGDGTMALSSSQESGIRGLKGGGQPLSPQTRGFMEPRFGADFGGVRVHTDSNADELARSINARAFTTGNDIAFRSGEYSPDTAGGRSLLAHELTHTIQQGGAIRRRYVQRAGGGGAGQGAESKGTIDAGVFMLPPIKSRHLPRYKSRKLVRTKGVPFKRGNPNQKEGVWLPAVRPPESKLKELGLEPSFDGKKTIVINKDKLEITATYDEWKRLVSVPNWDRNCKKYKSPFEVDHIVELQVANWPTDTWANTLSNMELLDKSSNASSGSVTEGSIKNSVKDYIRREKKLQPTQPVSRKEVDDILKENDISFTGVAIGYGGKVSESDSQFWSQEEIKQGCHLKDGKPYQPKGSKGNKNEFVLVSPTGGMVLGNYKHNGQNLMAVKDPVLQTRVNGIKIEEIKLDAGYDSKEMGKVIGTVKFRWNIDEKNIETPSGMAETEIKSAGSGTFAGYIDNFPALDASMKHLSPLKFKDISIDNGNLSAIGSLTPSLNLLGGKPLEVYLCGKAIEFAYEYNAGALALPIPGLTIDDSTLRVFCGTKGFGVAGEVDLSIGKLCSGNLSAKVGSAGGFEAAGKFFFDTALFDKADVAIWYKAGAFGGSGNLEIQKEGKVKGIKSAKVNVNIDGDKWSAEGTVEPSFPGVKSGKITVKQGEEGLFVGGTVELKNDIPGIKGGTLEAEVKQREEGWALSAKGDIPLNIPGVDTVLHAEYDDGAFDAKAKVDYKKGMLSGGMEVGVTNRAVTAEGPVGKPGGKLTVYGGGALTLQMTPWLKGTAGVKLLPNGELEVVGKVALPDQLEVFPEKKLTKKIFSINLDIPIVGVAVAGQRIGIFATIGGGLDLNAGFGPGVLRNVQVGIQYNPSREEDTTITGTAEFAVPAHAGLRLFVRGALGAGIPIVSATAGLEVGGELGVEGEASASAAVEWSPRHGLTLEATGRIFAEPKFKFDITGFVMVEADLWLTTIELYSKRWQLAAFEYGSGLRLGAEFPVKYKEGETFNISLDDVKFTVPQIDPGTTLKNLISKVV